MIALSLFLVLAQASGSEQSAGGLPWATCDDGEPADLRADIPVLVLTSADGDPNVPFWTAFVLYANGAIVARRGNQMIEWRAREGRVASFWNQVSGDQLFHLDATFDRTTPRERERAGRSFESEVTESEIHIWKDGCQKRIGVRGLNLLVAEAVVNRRHVPRVPAQDMEDARSVLAALPPALSTAIRSMLTYGAKGGRVWCNFKECFYGDKRLPHQDLWGPKPPRRGRRHSPGIRSR